jgi:PTS system mannose-specific IID component
MAVATNEMTRADLFRVFWRLLFMQSLLNHRGMQNLAVASALTTVAERLGDDDPDALIRRHLDHFNCNPNLVPLIVGGIINLEAARAQGQPVTPEAIATFKRTLTIPLAAMGDMLFLGALKPLALTFACIFAIYGLPIGLLAVFLLYNAIVISCRLWGVYFGYAKGQELPAILSGPEFQRLLGVVQGLGAGMGGVLAGVLIDRLPQHGQWALLVGVVIAGVTLFLLKRDIPASWLAIALFPICALFTLLFV